MNRFKVLIHKIPVKNTTNIDIFIKYQNELTRMAKKHKGFITSNSYFGVENNNFHSPIFNISSWNSRTDWNNWLSSLDRNNIKSSFNDCILSEKYYILHKKNKYDDFPFLL